MSPDWAASVADHKQRQMLHIGRAAVELTLREGPTSVSMSKLAQAAGVSRATLYNYVPDVITAIRLFLQKQGEAFHADVSAAVAQETGPEDKLRRYIIEHVAYVAGDDHRAACALMDSGALGPMKTKPAPNGDTPNHLRGLLEDILRDGAKTDVFSDDPDPQVQAVLITRVLYCAHELMNEHQLSQGQATDAITSTILRGIRADRPGPLLDDV